MRRALWCVVVVVCLHVACSSSLKTRKQQVECVEDFLLKAGYSGESYLPGTQGYKNATGIDNQRVAWKPLVVLAVASPNDITLSINASVACSVSNYSVLSGGHSAAGYSLNENGIVINLRPHFSDMKYTCSSGSCDTPEMYIEAGARWSEVYTYIQSQQEQVLAIGGGCPQVGIGGFLLGGGFSFLSRSYGLGSDNIVSLQMVLANGSLVECSATQNQDLFWASQGGGGGNFGVVTSFVVSLQRPKADAMLIGEICWPPFDRDVILALWKLWFSKWKTMPDWLDVDPVWLPITEDADPRMFCMTVICNNENDICAEELQVYLDYQPTYNTLAYEPFLDWQLQNVNITSAQEGLLYLTSGFLEEDALTVDTISELMDSMQKAPSTKSLVLFHVGGGAITKKSATETAYVHRSAELLIQLKAIWTDATDTNKNIQWVKDTRQIVAPYLNGSYINYIDRELDNWQEAYYGQNYPRLLAIKKLVDPNNFFHFAQSIGAP